MSAGVFSTSMSGVTPSFSIAHLPFEIVEREIRRGDAAVVDHVGHAEGADQSAPRARADERTELRGVEVVRKRVAA